MSEERWPLGRPLVGRLNGGLCEVRTTFDKNEYRVFFYVEREQVVVVHSTRRMRTSREAAYRLLDPTRTGVTLDSLQRAASALGLILNISFEPPARRPAASREGLAARRKKRAA